MAGEPRCRRVVLACAGGFRWPSVGRWPGPHYHWPGRVRADSEEGRAGAQRQRGAPAGAAAVHDLCDLPVLLDSYHLAQIDAADLGAALDLLAGAGDPRAIPDTDHRQRFSPVADEFGV